jgi:hypothetical protein
VIHRRWIVDHSDTFTSPKIRTSRVSAGDSNQNQRAFVRGFAFASLSVFVPVETKVAAVGAVGVRNDGRSFQR